MLNASVVKRTLSLLPASLQERESSESTDHPLNSSNPNLSESRSCSLSFSWDWRDSKILILEFESEVEDMYHKSMPLDKLYQKESLLTIKNTSMNHKKEKSKNFYSNMTDHFWSLIQEDASLKSTEDQVPEPDIKNLIDDLYIN